MPDHTRPAPRLWPSSTGKKTPIALPLTSDEVEGLFAVKPVRYQDYRALAACCIIVNSGLWLSEAIFLTIDDINQAQELLIYQGRPYPLKIKPCILFAYLAERRYRPPVRQLFTTMYGTPSTSPMRLHAEIAALVQPPVRLHRLRRVYLDRTFQPDT